MMDGSDNKRDENIHFFSDSDGINKKTGLRIILEYRPNYINSIFWQ
jgi:Holliday junction resolvasome RuvABC DNA-binding subunit